MKHGFMIMIHNNWEQAGRLLMFLDKKDNSLFIHVDKKSKFDSNDEQALRRNVQRATLIFVERVIVNWGGYSQIEAEMTLLQAALKYPLDYYHLISGVDLPIKNWETINRFFEENRGTQYVTYCPDSFQMTLQKRVKYFWFFQEYIGNPKTAIKNKDIFRMALLACQRALVFIQKIIGVDRRKKNSGIKFSIGANWFSITREFAEYVLARQEWIEKTFKHTLCCDEVIINTLLTNSRFNQRGEHNQRLVDWNRGNPYTFRYDDLQELMRSERLFARKFDPRVDPKIIDAIYEQVANDDVQLQ